MESLALLATLIVLSLFALSVASLVLTFLNWRTLGAVLGLGAIAMGIWLALQLPANPWLGLLNILAGSISVVRFLKKRN